jgi:hypothetical protein
MMSTVGRYASRTLLGHLALTFIGFVGLLQVLDLLNDADNVLARHGNSIAALAKYAVLRLPDLANFILPFAVLIAALLTIAKLARSNEILALKASGMSFYRLLLSLVPQRSGRAANCAYPPALGCERGGLTSCNPPHLDRINGARRRHDSHNAAAGSPTAGRVAARRQLVHPHRQCPCRGHGPARRDNLSADGRWRVERAVASRAREL